MYIIMCVCVCVGVLQMEIIKKIKIMVGREPFRPSPERLTVPAPGCSHRHQNTKPQGPTRHRHILCYQSSYILHSLAHICNYSQKG